MHLPLRSTNVHRADKLWCHTANELIEVWTECPGNKYARSSWPSKKLGLTVKRKAVNSSAASLITSGTQVPWGPLNERWSFFRAMSEERRADTFALALACGHFWLSWVYPYHSHLRIRSDLKDKLWTVRWPMALQVLLELLLFQHHCRFSWWWKLFSLGALPFLHSPSRWFR